MKGDYQNELGRLIAQARKAKGHSQVELARLIGYRRPEVNYTLISAIEHGRNCPGEGREEAFCRVLDLDPARVADLCIEFRRQGKDQKITRRMIAMRRYADAAEDPEVKSFIREMDELHRLEPDAFAVVRQQGIYLLGKARKQKKEG